MTLETKVTVSDDTHKMVFLINHRNATDMIVMHHIQSILDSTPAANGNRIIDHTILSTFDDSYLTSLLLNRHILMDNTDTALTRDGNGHRRLGHRIHSGRDKRNVEFYVT